MHWSAAGSRGTHGAAMLALAVSLLGGACAGTEQAVFALVDPLVTPPAPPPDNGGANGGNTPPPFDAGNAPLGGSDAPEVVPDASVDVGPDPGLDPTVRFTWTETLPGAGTCRGGRYAGSFICSSVALLVPIVGEVSVLLSVAPEQQKLAIEEGTVKGTFFMAPEVQGGLDCPTRAFDGFTVDGMDLFTQERFEASLTGTLDLDTLVIDGEVVMTNAAGQECRGALRLGAAP